MTLWTKRHRDWKIIDFFKHLDSIHLQFLHFSFVEKKKSMNSICANKNGNNRIQWERIISIDHGYKTQQFFILPTSFHWMWQILSLPILLSTKSRFNHAPLALCFVLRRLKGGQTNQLFMSTLHKKKMSFEAQIITVEKIMMLMNACARDYCLRICL